jgi:hypoxanthine phosphoribosyltransferase
LKGSFIFAADLVRELSFSHVIEFVRVSSYGSGMVSGEVKVEVPPDVSSRHILIVEDIVDTGKSIVKLKEILEEQSPLSVKVCALLDKPSRRVIDCKVDFCGFKVKNAFVVGYGLDFNERFRALKYIGEVKE